MHQRIRSKTVAPGDPAEATMTEIRPVRPDDVPAIAALFQRTFRGPRRTAPAALERYLAELLFEDPGREPDMASQVAADGPELRGFIGVLPLRMAVAGRTIRAAAAGSLMVDDPARDPLVGARLFRAYLNGPQDFSFSESANAISRGMWLRLGGASSAPYGMDWFKVIGPARFALAVGARRFGPLSALAGLGRAADRFAARRASTEDGAPPASEAADEAGFAEALGALGGTFALSPGWSAEALVFRLRHAAAKEGVGRFERRLVRDSKGALAGAWAAWLPKDGIAQALQTLARPGASGLVISSLLATARAAGCAGLRGRCTPRDLDAVLDAGAMLVRRSSMMVKGRDAAEALAAVAAGEALITGLACEAWSRLIGDDFAESRR
jgi:hypothetical protein